MEGEPKNPKPKEWGNLISEDDIKWMKRKIDRDFNSWKKPESEQSGYVLSSKSKKDSRDTYFLQPTDKMLEFDNMVRGLPHSSILCPLQATRKWPSLGTMLFNYEGEEPSKVPKPHGVAKISMEYSSEEKKELESRRAEMAEWSKQAEKLIQSLGYITLRRPDWEGKETDDDFYVLKTEGQA
ncbi:MAG: hypothetical protein AAB408_01325 [Patescibacteria group bacterium]